jgi:DNA repair exonuclease SbcCD nuclease subunit
MPGACGDDRNVKLGIIGDAHLGCADYTEKRRADFAIAFKSAVEVCMANGAAAICFLGDVFDSALMRRNVEAFAATIREVGPVFTRLKEGGVPVLAIAGNHEFGRGREAGELGVLESLGFLYVLRGQERFLNGECSIVGFPWHAEEEVHALPDRVRELRPRLKSKHRVLLLHNFVRGSTRIPSHLGEIDQTICEGFDRVFVGHHHDAEEVGPFVMPGATEVQNLAEADQQKSVVVYDTTSGKAVFHKLPKTRDIVLLHHDMSEFVDRKHLFDTLAAKLGAKDVTTSFVCVRLVGQPRLECVVSKADIVNFLRGLNVIDRFVDVRTKRPTRDAPAVVYGASIEARLRNAFEGQAEKAQRYINECTDESFPATIVEEILR